MGKASVSFQAMLPVEATSGLARVDLRVSSAAIASIPHAVVGQVAVGEWLEAHEVPSPQRTQVAEIIGGHHGTNPESTTVRDAMNKLALEDSAWAETRAEIIDRVADLSGFRSQLRLLGASGVPLPARVLIEAIVILADWIASNVDYFPYQDDRTSQERADDAWDALGFAPPWSPALIEEPADLFSQRFPSLAAPGPNRLQVDVSRAALAASDPCLMIIEAQPGLGKTEAGLLAAEILAARFDAGGMFFGLPTMATSNPMFERVRAWMETMQGQDNSVNLAHSKAALYDGFDKLVRRSRVSSITDPESTREAARVVAWLRGRKRALLSNMVVGTIDQFLMGGLKAKHVVLRHIALAGKVVVLDEIHAADEHMREYALTMLAWMGRYGVPTVLMSATLPPEQRAKYVTAYTGQKPEAVGETEVYPRITIATTDGVSVSAPPPSDDHTVAVERIVDDDQAIRDVLDESLVDGGCVGIIRNTVTAAQRTFENLRGIYGDGVVLLHSRFIAPHRLARESALVNQLNRDGDRPHKLIVVGTQVLEQSLDLDFDLLITDVAPIDLIFQRMGRLHRHDRRSRPSKVARPRALLVAADWDTQVPEFDRGSIGVYGQSQLMRAVAVLLKPIERGGLTVPQDIPRLVAQGYAANLACPEGWTENWAAAEKAHAVRTREARDRAKVFLVSRPKDQTPMSRWLSGRTDDPDASDADSTRSVGRAQVRDGGDSVEVIALQRGRDGILRLFDPVGRGTAIPEGSLPLTDTSLAKQMARHTVSLPAWLCQGNQLDKTLQALEHQPVPYELWQESPWIRGQLAIVFDAHGKAELAGFTCNYTQDLGLVIERRKEES